MNTTAAAFDQLIDRYLQNRRALGRAYVGEERVLRSLRSFLMKREAIDLDQETFERWCHAQVALGANTRRNRQLVVRNFCLYRQRTEPDCFVPDNTRFTRSCPYRSPVIFGPVEVTRMLSVADRLAPTPASPLRACVMRLAVVLLYTAGLRRGELTGLTLADIDTQRGILRIRESKFHKSRLVPLSFDACRELKAYLRRRLEPPFCASPSSFLLCNGKKETRGYSGGGLGQGVRMLLKAANVRDVSGRTPRVQDFRHNFAIGALLRWYKQGADVQSKLPLLAMYMGHVSIVSTACYLKLIPELAEAASRRFENQFGHLITGDAA